jgi:deazaflavin-dependent oxidoreductase (nitroreductase family)
MSTDQPPYTPPAPDSLLNEEHIRQYEATNGEVGYEWNGATCLILHTTGRKSGKVSKRALIYAPDGDNYLVVASMGGAPKHPVWYLNVTANPEVTIQVKERTLKARARTATDEERPRLWKIVNEKWPNYTVYETRTDRKIPVVVLEPIPDDGGK